MDEGMLLRKVSVDPATPVIVTDHCLTQTRKSFPKVGAGKNRELRKQLLLLIAGSVDQDLVFENPKRKDQHIAAVHLGGMAGWVLLSMEDGVLIAVSVRVHRDRDYADEMKEVHNE